MPSPRSGLYDDPAIYDILHAPGTAEEVNGLEQIERRFVDPELTRNARLWLEPACGTARYLRLAARRGVDVLGFDLSEHMIDYAREHAPDAGPGVGRSTYLVANMTAFARHVLPRRASLAFNLINTIRHLPGDDAMRAHFDEIARVLAPGGVYIVGLSLTAYGCEAPTEDAWIGARARTKVTQVVQYVPARSPGNASARSELVASHLVIERAGRPTEHRDSSYRLRTYSLEQWEALLGRSALEIRASIDESGQDHPAADGGYCLFVLAPRSGRRRR